LCRCCSTLGEEGKNDTFQGKASVGVSIKDHISFFLVQKMTMILRGAAMKLMDSFAQKPSA
jgi:hypothetical protein